MKEKYDVSVLKEVIVSINKCGLLEENEIAKIKMIGKKNEALFKEFAETVEKIPDEQASNLPENVIEFYMTFVNPSEEEPSEETTEKEGEEEMKKDDKKKPVAKKKEAPVAKKEAPVAKKKPVEKVEKKVEKKKEAPVAKKKPVEKVEKKVEKDIFGYKVGSQANKIDDCLISAGGATVKEMAAACKSTESRVRSHLYTLIKLKGVPIVVKDGKYVYSKKGKK